jgi:hypothetical protein
MTRYTQVLNTNKFHQKIKDYILNEIDVALQESKRMDHILIQEEHPDNLHQSQMVCYKLDKLIEHFYTHQHEIEDWFYEIDRSLQQPQAGRQLHNTNLGFDGVRIHRSSIRCDFLKPSLVKKLLDNAKDFAIRRVLPEKQKFSTGDVLSFYFENYLREEMYDFKLECASKLKRLHRKILERPPLNSIPLDLLDTLDYEFMYRATRKWVDDNEFGVDVGPTPSSSSHPETLQWIDDNEFGVDVVPTPSSSSSSHLTPIPRAANPTKKLRAVEDMDDWDLDF